MINSQVLSTDAQANLSTLENTAQAMLDILKVQFTPSTECISLNDVTVKDIFIFGVNATKRALDGKKYKLKQKNKTKKKDAIFSEIGMENSAGYDNKEPFTEFDRAVMEVVVSEIAYGNRYLTVNIIYRALCGKIGQADDGVKPMKNQKAAIENSVEKLMKRIVNFSGVTESLKQMKYTDNDGNYIILKKAPLLSGCQCDAKINGQLIEDIYFFSRQSPLFQIADAKNQIVRYPHELLNVPNQNNTPLVISLKKYVMRRICEIKLHSKQLKPTITFEDVFTKCRLGNANKFKREDARNSILKFFEHLKEQNFITNFEVVKRGNSIYAITFEW